MKNKKIQTLLIAIGVISLLIICFIIYVVVGNLFFSGTDSLGCALWDGFCNEEYLPRKY